jgi:hypothetical protein
MASDDAAANALRESIERKGANSYYYAHANTSTMGLKTTLNEPVGLDAGG